MFTNCVKLYWYCISSSWNRKTPPKKKKQKKNKLSLKSPTLLGLNNNTCIILNSKPMKFRRRYFEIWACFLSLWVNPANPSWPLPYSSVSVVNFECVINGWDSCLKSTIEPLRHLFLILSIYLCKSSESYSKLGQNWRCSFLRK